MGMRSGVIIGAVLAASVSLPANARLPEAFSNLPIELVRSAVHLPTGCLAQVTVSEQRVVRANIVDKDCLPKGVSAQPIPGQTADFSIIDANR